MRFSCFLAALALLLFPANLLADGCILSLAGEYIPETEQHAYIEWKNGREKLYVATHAETSTGGTSWILPVPAKPDQVKVKPVEEFPKVGRFYPAVKTARHSLKVWMFSALMLDTGFCCCLPGSLGVGLGGGAKSPEELVIHHHVEKLGMVVEVITTKSTGALDQYLAAKNLGVKAQKITALAPYLQKDFSLICAWVADPVEAKKGRALSIEFPTPHVFFPLQPTRVYTSDIKTSIFVKGWWQPTPGTQLPGLRCRPGYNSTMPVTEDDFLTHVELSASPQNWTEDLILEEGAPLALHVAREIDSIWIVLHLSVGALCGLILPWLFVPKKNRNWGDWVLAGVAGLSIIFTIFASAFILFPWLREQRWPKGELYLAAVMKSVLVLACLHLLVLGVFYLGFDFWLSWYDSL